MDQNSQIEIDGFTSLRTLRQVAKLSNVLARRLSGPTRTLAYAAGFSDEGARPTYIRTAGSSGEHRRGENNLNHPNQS